MGRGCGHTYVHVYVYTMYMYCTCIMVEETGYDVALSLLQTRETCLTSSSNRLQTSLKLLRRYDMSIFLHDQGKFFAGQEIFIIKGSKFTGWIIF